MTLVPAIVATGVTGRWDRGGDLHNPANVDPSRSSAALWEGKIQFHPETSKDDPAYQRWGGGHD
jgi:P-type Ca2+ transporter type 2C